MHSLGVVYIKLLSNKYLERHVRLSDEFRYALMY